MYPQCCVLVCSLLICVQKSAEQRCLIPLFGGDMQSVSRDLVMRLFGRVGFCKRHGDQIKGRLQLEL